MKYKNIIILIFSALAISCSSDGGSEGTGSENNGNNNGNNNNSGGSNNSGETTDPDDFSSTTSSGNTTYYISFTSGNDDNDGKSEDSAFKNLGKINSITYKPGDKIMFKSGDSWRGYFKILMDPAQSLKLMEMDTKLVFFLKMLKISAFLVYN